MLYALVFAVLVISVSGAPSGGTGRLTGGTQATRGQFPYVVSVSRKDQHICGGFVYNDRWVVTAASCIIDEKKADIKVNIGALSLITPDPEEQIIEVFSNVTFPTYNRANKLHDIALIELSRPIVFGTTASSIRYDEIDELANSPWVAAIVGWGAISPEGTPATRLRSAPIDDLDANCQDYGNDEFQKNYMICAGSTTGVSPCQFDEGSPLTQQANYGGIPENIVVGIVSKNKGCGDPSIPTIYTRLATYYSWLLQTAGQQPAPTRV